MTARDTMTSRKPLKRPNVSREEDEDDTGPPSSKRRCSAASSSRLAMTDPAPLSSDLPPPPKRDSQLTYEEAKRGTEEPVRVYADGVFDLFHNGHARVLMQAKNAFPNTYLIVGVTSDELTHSMKGKTVCSESERYDAIRHCRYVDELIEDAPWTLTPEFLEEHQIDFVAHDDIPYSAGDAEDIYKPLKDMGKFVATQRTPGVSTSDIIARIVRDYNMYVSRNLDRGYSAKDLNVGYMKEKEVRIRKRMSNLKHRMEAWEERSMEGLRGFVGLFGRDGRIAEFFHNQKDRIKNALSPTASPPSSSGSDDDTDQWFPTNSTVQNQTDNSNGTYSDHEQ